MPAYCSRCSSQQFNCISLRQTLFSSKVTLLDHVRVLQSRGWNRLNADVIDSTRVTIKVSGLNVPLPYHPRSAEVARHAGTLCDNTYIELDSSCNSPGALPRQARNYLRHEFLCK